MKDLPIRDQAISYLTMEGWTNEEIASCLQVPIEVIRLKLTDERIQEKSRNLHYQIYSEDSKKRYQDMLPHAMRVIEDILKDPMAKPQLKIDAAREVTDRVLGKPKQTVEHEGSLIRAFLERLSSPEMIATEPALPVPYRELPPGNPNVSTPVVTKDNPNFQEDMVDQWMKKNLP
jgi:hypothetical protein